MRDVLEERVTELDARVERNDRDVVLHFGELMAFFRAQMTEVGTRFDRLEGRVTALEGRFAALEDRAPDARAGTSHARR